MSDKAMDRIQLLLNQAAGAGTDAERATFQAKAEELMHKHRIDGIMLRMRNAEKEAAEPRRTQVVDEMIEWVPSWDEFRDTHAQMVGHLGRLAGIMIVHVSSRLHLIGYPDDIAYFRMLWVSTHLTFSGKLFPEWKRELSDGDNIRNFAESGYKWLYIWDAARKAGAPLMRKKRGTSEVEPVPAPPNDGGYMKRAMAQSYRRDGIEKPQLTHGVKNYRDSYAQAFADVVNQRADDMWQTRRIRENEAGSGVGLVLKKDADALIDYFESLYPPGSTKASQTRRKLAGTHAGAAQRGAAAGRSVDFSAGKGGLDGAQRREIG